MTSIFRELSPEDENAEQVQLIEKRRQNYAAYGLQTNPFPLGGNFPEGYLQYTHLAKQEIRIIQDFLLSTFEREEFNGLLILGEYGAGKSHLLNLIDREVNADLSGLFGGRALAFVIQNPSVSPDDILLSMLRQVKLNTVQDLIFLPVRKQLHDVYQNNMLSFLRDYTHSTGGSRKSEQQVLFDSTEYRPKWTQDVFSKNYREFLKVLSDKNVELNIAKMQILTRDILREKMDSDETIINSLVGLVFGKYSDTVRSWDDLFISGFTGKRGQGVEFYLEAFLKLFREMGIKHIYLLVDEIEDLRTQRINSKAATEYLATLRKMIQHNYRSFSFVLASTTDAWNELKALYPAIDDRFPIKIPLLRQSRQLKDIIRSYLKNARPDAWQDSDPWFPFTEEAIDKIISIRGVVLRHVLTACRQVLDHAINNETTPPIRTDHFNQDLFVEL